MILMIYLAMGFVFAMAFLMKGISIVDEGTKGSTNGFKIIILPGVIVFWPFLLNKWKRSLKDKK